MNHPNHHRTFDTIIVGSGPGGSSVAKSLTEQGQRVCVVEMGSHVALKGSFMQMANMAAIPGKGAFIHSDLSLVMRAITAGGSSVINFATAVEPPFARFQALGIDLYPSSQKIKQQLPISSILDTLMGDAAKILQQSAQTLDYQWNKFDKFIRTDNCHSHCHRCAYGCPHQAKWSARDWLHEAQCHGATLLTNATVETVLINNNRANGIRYHQRGKSQQLFADNIVLAAGGIGTPRILASSGFDNVLENYFVDPVVAVMGQVDHLNGGNELPMCAGMHLPEHGVTLSDLALPRPFYQAFSAQVGRVDKLFSHRKMLSIMVKVADQPGGKIGSHWINKSLSSQDKERLTLGKSIARKILYQAGATAIFSSHHFAAHPGGSAAIGKVVDNNLKTPIDGLYLCDASVLPSPWGIAPSFTLLCLGTRLAEHLQHKETDYSPAPALHQR